MPSLKTFLMALCLQLLPFGVKAQDLDATFSRLCSEAGVSKELTMAIAKHESGMNPLALNVAGQAHSPKGKAEASAIIRKAHVAGYSYDVGLMQINRCWIERWGIAPESLLDPEANIRAGLKVLSSEIARLGFTWEAVGAYHSPSPGKSTRYAWLIYNLAKGGAAPTSNSNTTGRKDGHSQTGNQSILLYRRDQPNSGASAKGRTVRVELR